MRSSTSSSDPGCARSTDRRASCSRRGVAPVLLALAVCGSLLAAWMLAVQPRLPEPLRRADLRPGELRWFESETVVAYLRGEPSPASVLFLGDSRVHHALDDGALDDAGLGACLLWIGGAQLGDLSSAARELEPKRLVVALSALSLHREGDRAAELALARRLEDRPLTARIDRALDDAASDLRARWIRVLDPKPWMDSWFERASPRATDARERRDLRPETRARRAERLEELAAALATLLAEGRSIACVRLPISPSLRAVEEEAFPGTAFAELCERLGIPYLDRSEAKYETTDGSHLTAASARRFSADLAQDLARIFAAR